MLQRPWIALVVALAIVIAIFALGQPDFVASDPLWYADIAHRLALDPAGVLVTHDVHPFMMRIGLTVPLAVVFKLFGVSTTTANLPTLFAALTILLVIYAAAPTPRAKLVALGLGVFSTALIQNSVVLGVDLPCAALMAVSVLWLSWRDRPRGDWWLAAAVCAWLAAFLVKEVAVWCAPVWIYAAICDRRQLRRWIPAVATGAVLGGAYLAFSAAVWGSPLARFHGIDDLTDEHAWKLPGQPVRAWIDRLTWQPPVLLAKLFQVTLLPALVAPWLVRGRERIWCVAAAAFVALYWFGSSSVSAYAPLPISPRMVLPALPPILVLAALACDRALDELHRVPWRVAIAVVIALAIAGPPARAMYSLVVRAHPERAVFARVRADVDAEPAQRFVIVCGEPRCVQIGGFYFGFELPPNATVIFANDFAEAAMPAGARVVAVVNFPRAAGARRTNPDLDRTEAIATLKLPVLAGNKNVKLYDAGDGARLWQALRH